MGQDERTDREKEQLTNRHDCEVTHRQATVQQAFIRKDR